MSAIAADLARRSQAAAGQAAAGPPEAGPGAGAELEVFGRLAVALDGNTAEMRRHHSGPRIPWEACHPVTLAPAQSSAAGTLADPERWGPRSGWAWQVTGLTVQLGAGASQWSIYQDAVSPTNLKMQNTVSGLWEPKGWILLPGMQIVYAGTGGGIIVSIGSAIEVSLDWLADYLM